MLFAEQDGHQHIHFHVVPRMRWFSEEECGTGVLQYLSVPPNERVPKEEQDRLASLLGGVMGRELDPPPRV